MKKFGKKPAVEGKISCFFVLILFARAIDPLEHLREPVFRCIVDQGWTLLELHREQTSLEQVFRQLTGAEEVIHA